MKFAFDGLSSLLLYRSSNQNMLSSAVKGWPSDHFMPLRRWIVIVLPSSLTSQPFATCGTTWVTVGSQCSKWSYEIRSMF
jgi:hypothetical protein